LWIKSFYDFIVGKEKPSVKIDIYNHFIPKKYYEALSRHLGKPYPAAQSNPGIIDLDCRFRILDKYDGLVQVLSPGGAPLEGIAQPKKATELARIANDAMAETVAKHPDRFVGAVALVATNDVDAAFREIERAIEELNFKGLYLFTPQFLFKEGIGEEPEQSNEEGGTRDGKGPEIKGHTVGKLPKETAPLDQPELIPLFEQMAKYDLPIWIHPRTTPAFADYTTEKSSKYRIWQIFGWPYQTAAAMTRLVFSGLFERFPKIKIITHHAGSMVPFFEQRIRAQYDYDEILFHGELKKGLSEEPLVYFKMFHGDTALNGNTAALMCAHQFFGAGHLLFGTDMPHDAGMGDLSISETITSVERMDISAKEKRMIFEDNAKKLLRIT
jgi:aminocarboxymuconate-semialdehyde decarboxylase